MTEEAKQIFNDMLLNVENPGLAAQVDRWNVMAARAVERGKQAIRAGVALHTARQQNAETRMQVQMARAASVAAAKELADLIASLEAVTAGLLGTT